ncbi:hypothetical protein CDAR_524951 [Caerostris darwini]|uniref:Uncharacterized protein n=1 Tax=Caerostris darwini TaxID=1538125 RepID=A0AAV4QX93_9ARAC|nr:hypothetical protein CDAR_524951 [Caerostris darwini]
MDWMSTKQRFHFANICLRGHYFSINFIAHGAIISSRNRNFLGNMKTEARHLKPVDEDTNFAQNISRARKERYPVMWEIIKQAVLFLKIRHSLEKRSLIVALFSFGFCLIFLPTANPNKQCAR